MPRCRRERQVMLQTIPAMCHHCVVHDVAQLFACVKGTRNCWDTFHIARLEGSGLTMVNVQSSKPGCVCQHVLQLTNIWAQLPHGAYKGQRRCCYSHPALKRALDSIMAESHKLIISHPSTPHEFRCSPHCSPESIHGLSCTREQALGQH